MSELKSPQDIVNQIRSFLPGEPSTDDVTRLQKWLLKDIKNYGRYKKINGAKSLAKLVKEMRLMQDAYFRNRSSNNQAARQLLYEAKKLEEQVDRVLEVILK